MGNLFASPSTQRAYSVAKAADQGRGVLFSYGNYAGDVLNFDAAQDQLRGRGHRLPHRAGHRRHLQRPARRDRQAPRHRRRPDGLQGRRRRRRGGRSTSTRSSGWPGTPTTAPGPSASPSTAARCPAQTSRCSPCPRGGWRSGWASTASPASTRPTCPPRTSSPSCSCPGCSTRCPTAIDVSGARVVPILNGLGSVKYEELFVVYRSVDRLLAGRRRRGRRPRGRRVLHELRHGRVLADPALAGRRAGAALDRARGHPRLPARLGRASGSGWTPTPPRPSQRDDPAGQCRVPAGGRP